MITVLTIQCFNTKSLQTNSLVPWHRWYVPWADVSRYHMHVLLALSVQWQLEPVVVCVLKKYVFAAHGDCGTTSKTNHLFHIILVSKFCSILWEGECGLFKVLFQHFIKTWHRCVLYKTINDAAKNIKLLQLVVCFYMQAIQPLQCDSKLVQQLYVW
jgi:hypothetical protein